MRTLPTAILAVLLLAPIAARAELPWQFEVHPTNAGHRAIAEAFKAVIQ